MVPHDRTTLGRHFLKMREELRGWIEAHRDTLPEDDVVRAERLACELYVSAYNGTTIGVPDNQANTRG